MDIPPQAAPQLPATQYLQVLLLRFHRGDGTAREELINHSLNRMQHLARKWFHRETALRALHQTDDIVQEAILRVLKALDQTRPTEVVAFVGLLARQVRWVLADLARQRQRIATPGWEGEVPAPTETHQAHLQEFHTQIDNLPEEHRQMFDLLFYEELSQEEVAHLLNVSIRTVKRRWQASRLALHQKLQELTR
ncbi:MAG: sigma-70 family RNA polymerase sigma factor [Gemmataceae bacterium]